MRYLITALLSALLIWFAPHLHNSDTAKPHHTSKPIHETAAITQTVAKPVRPAKAEVVTPKPKPTITVAKAVTPKPHKQVANGCERYKSVFEQYQWNVHTALAICQAESGGNVYALSPTRDRGLMQINSVHADKVDYDLNKLYNPYTNIRVAYTVYLSQGWHGWSTYNNRSYLAYL